MNGQERLREILDHRSEHCGFWHGNPNDTYKDELFAKLGVANDFEMGLKLGDTCRWVMAEHHGLWKHPEGKPMWDVLAGQERTSLG